MFFGLLSILVAEECEEVLVPIWHQAVGTVVPLELNVDILLIVLVDSEPHGFINDSSHDDLIGVSAQV